MTEVNHEILKDLISCQDSPCVSIYMSTKPVRKGEFKKLEIEFKNLLQETEKKLKDIWDYKQRDVDKFLDEAAALAADINFWQEQKEGLAVFISENQFDFFKLPIDIYNSTHVSQCFNLKQLISGLWYDKKYYILALSPNFNQLYRADRNTLAEIELKELPTNIKEFLNIDDEGAQGYQSMARAGSASVFHGEGAADDDQEDLLHYLKEIDRVVFKKLKSKDDYLLIVADDKLFSLYKDEINSYSNLLDENLSGNVKDMNRKELKEKSWEIVEPHIHDYLKSVKDQFAELKGSEKISKELEDIIEAAYFSRVDSLLINKKADKEGVFSPEEKEIKDVNDRENYDLYNYAAVQTILNGGKVYPLSEDKMPDNADIAAIYRY
ncbi:MAG: hypothetical protein D5S01_01795 [Halanaerobium sp. MSAO_Bac5]|nr:MAG: hypothetical protein D5S01_01795 [Halanaerobium sp. MSAO_Bac5]